jgi:hypothetical protein
MFRPLLVRPSSGWIQWSEELYNNSILSLKSGRTRSRLQKIGHAYRQVVWKYMHYYQSVITYLSIIGRLLRGLGVPLLFVDSGRGGWVLQRSAVVAVWSFQVCTFNSLADTLYYWGEKKDFGQKIWQQRIESMDGILMIKWILKGIGFDHLD